MDEAEGARSERKRGMVEAVKKEVKKCEVENEEALGSHTPQPAP